MPAPRDLVRSLIAGALLLMGAADTRAQSVAAAPDSGAAFRIARQAQSRFESIRRSALPLRDATPRTCEVTLGRYCYWHDTTERRPDGPEPTRVGDARRRLVAALDSLGARHPGDRWIAGQRVRYRIDGGDTTGAITVAESGCAAAVWWCAALAGYARHVSGDFAGAERRFAEALAAMDSTRRCEWDDPAILLEPRARERLQRLPCPVRARVARHAWWLATPLLATTANDLRTELLARRTVGELEADARLIYATSWSWDTRELLLRYGWPTWFTRERSPSIATPSATPSLVGHEPTPGFHLPPASDAVTDTTRLPDADAWQPRRERPASRYAPAYARAFHRMDAQIARVRRGDSIVIDAAFAPPRDTLIGTDARVRVVVQSAPEAPRHVGAGTSVTVPGHSATRPTLASVEVTDSSRRGVAVHRSALAPMDDGRLRVSDLVLHTRAEAEVRAFEDVRARMLPSLVLDAPRVGIYWETYGLAAGGESVAVSLTMERTRASGMRRAAEALGLATRASPISVRWTETPGAATGHAARSVTLDLTSLAAGTYRMQLVVTASDGARATTERFVEILR